MEYEMFRLLLALLCVGLLVAYPHDHQPQKSEKSVQYCGTQLSTAISVICNGYYNSYITNTPKPFITRREAKTLRRRRRGIIDECCRNSCTKEELSSFCGAR